MLSEFCRDYQSELPTGGSVELRAQRNVTMGVSMVSGSLVANSRNEVSGVSARMRKGGVYGFASEATDSPEAVRRVLQAAADNAGFLDGHVCKNLPALAPQPSSWRPLSRGFDEPEQKRVVDFVRALDDRIAARYPNLASRTLVVRADCMEKCLVTNDAGSGHTVSPRCYVYCMMTALSPEGQPVELFLPLGGFGTFDENFSDPAALDEPIDELYEKLMQKREGVYAEAGLKTCILDGQLAGMLAHEAVGHTVEADIVQSGSVAARCMGKQVASELVSMTDFAHTAFGKPAPLPVYLDDEGVEATDVPLIENGILVGYMHSRESAQRFETRPCGNARAWLFSDEPLIRMRNTAIHPGKSTFEELIASVDDGYYLIDTNNGEADTTGEFMFGVTMGYEIKKGKLGRAILDTTISGVAFDMLKTVDMVSDRVVWASSGYCGKKQIMPVGLGGPALRCKITIGGR